MNVLKNVKRITAGVLITALVICAVPFKSFAAAGTIYESENNNTRQAADRTYDDYDNFGTIGSSADVDWWVYTATYTGFANIWLGSITSGCNYDLYMYLSDGTYLSCSVQTSGTQEIMRCRLTANSTYYVKVVTAGGYSAGSQYKLRFKNNPIGYTRLFAYTYNIDTTPTASSAISCLWQMGYDGQYYTDNLPIPVYNTIPSSRIVMIDNHGGPGRIRCNNSLNPNALICGQNNSTIDYNDRYISSYADGELSEVRLIIFSGCETGKSDSTYGSLIEQSLLKGASCAVGWNRELSIYYSAEWNKEFFRQCKLNKNVANAMTGADNYIRNMDITQYYIMQDRYSGKSRTGSIVI